MTPNDRYPPTGAPRDGLYRFGRCLVDPMRRLVLVDGRAVDAQPKVFDLLVYLIEHRERVVDKRELLDALWPDTVVTEASLTQAVRKLRQLLGDDAQQPDLIRTVSRRGFQFIAPLVDGGRDQSPSIIEERSDRAKPPSIAVMPFADMSAQRDQGYFCEGIAAEIVNALYRVEGLRVASRTSTVAASHARLDIRELGARLGVGHVLEGSVRRSGERLRVTAELVDAAAGFQVWSERWDREARDVFDIQDEIAMRIVGALKKHLSARDREAVLSTPTPSVTAYDHYLKGLGLLNRFGRRSQRFAIEHFRKALEIDPSYVPAWSGLAGSHALLYLYAEATPDNAQQARDAADRAVALDAASAEAHTARGMAAALTGDFDAAKEAFERAVALDPRLFEAWHYYARTCASFGRFEQAAQFFEKAAALRPDDYEALCLLIQVRARLGDPPAEQEAAQRAVAALRRAVELNPADVRALSLGAGSLTRVGDHDAARDWTRRAVALEPDEPSVNYNAACAMIRCGDLEQALDYLERVGVAGMANRSWMEHDAELDPLRTHPRFISLLEQAR